MATRGLVSSAPAKTIGRTPMAHIRTIAPADADGKLKAIYDAALARAGRVYQILRVQSLNPQSLQASMALYMATTTSAHNALPRWVREGIATLVSAVNRCRY